MYVKGGVIMNSLSMLIRISLFVCKKLAKLTNKTYTVTYRNDDNCFGIPICIKVRYISGYEYSVGLRVSKDFNEALSWYYRYY